MVEFYPNLYPFNPSLAAAIIFIVLFLIISVIHTYQIVRSKTWYFIPFVIGGFFEFVGFVMRAVSSTETHKYTLGPYAVNAVLVLVAPALFAASMYMELGRIIRLTDGEQLSIIRRTRLTKIFVTGDVIAFVVQAAGASILSGKSENLIKIGQYVILVGLAWQIVFFGLFVVVAIVFDRRLRRQPTPKSLDPSIPWAKHMTALYIGSALIMVRCIYRLIEYALGHKGFNTGYLLRHEWNVYVLDAVLMWLVMVLFAWVHPSEVKALLNGHGRIIKRIFFVETIQTPSDDEAMVIPEKP